VRRLAPAIAIVAGILIADQLTKAWAVRNLADGPIVLIDGFLALRLVYNPGAAFSSFQGLGPLIGVLAVAVTGWIVLMMRRTSRTVETLALSLVLAGALGNLIDRAVRGDGFLDGAVVDFVDLWRIPTFNVADAAITCGAVLLVWAALTSARHHPEPGGDAPGDG